MSLIEELQDNFGSGLNIKLCKHYTETYLEFDLYNQEPFWQSKKKNWPTLSQMLNDIKNWLNQITEIAHDNTKAKLNDLIKDFRFKTLQKMILYTANGEDEGTQTIEIVDKMVKSLIDKTKDSSFTAHKDKKISYQIGEATLFLKDASSSIVPRSLTPSFICEVHEILMKDLMSGCSSEEGKYRSAKAFTKYAHEQIDYEDPEHIENRLCHLCDHYNYMLVFIYEIRNDKQKQMEIVFKCCAWFILNFLKIHPFSDGNGRTARLIASYILGIISPIEIPIYNVYSDSNKEEYVQTIKLGQQDCSKRGLLAIMIIESCWHMLFDLAKKMKL
ncbi:uncharacterized protein TRIADDRAFT_56834 [Trichoplax adhaerens]|uniref:Fido domain-containing protein n=1 Tax=Trichoplax adhaerens TaxID=10228 RepID=B3RWP9_TRIAD|nr:predicted protein [Trichoplax adhaerens]EDV24734.1 predicted protein [Trichoplax adhaerens]|eukprot:XP_002112624.1 predicted protein [Trichoplax adhaerens]